LASKKKLGWMIEERKKRNDEIFAQKLKDNYD